MLVVTRMHAVLVHLATGVFDSTVYRLRAREHPWPGLSVIMIQISTVSVSVNTTVNSQLTHHSNSPSLSVLVSLGGVFLNI